MTPRGRRPAITYQQGSGIGEYPQQYLACRDLGHTWRRRDDFRLVRNHAGHIIEFTRLLVCESCGKERHDRYSTRGLLLGRYYVDPPGYASTRDAPIRGDHARAEELRRMLAAEGLSA